MKEICSAPGFWCLNSDLKYLTIRVDTRDRQDFKVYVDGRDGMQEIDADLVIDAVRRWRAKFPGLYPEPANEEWNTGPAPYGVRVRVKLANGCVMWARWVKDATLNEDHEPCDQWQAEDGEDHPESWHDGACWDSNAEGNASTPVIGWKRIAERAAA
ncbi:hypothetical protein [Thalassospira sp.]|uniref:hypothetical protein n=1 Tax=Thalassospira sp. TaxID=1912094 RepID=UPI000C538D24|nr:hypothetical protein [Thalassospira sp.]MBC05684.1 hypothetical protein [Thalassospira sp.]|tara:strand:- start:3365 stop:3835 length:471 start_codon:yes stop_codon:yes gene_type:complete